MCSNPAYVNVTNDEFHNDDQPIPVTSYIKDIMLIAHIIHRQEVGLHIRQVLSLRLFGYFIPTFKCYSGILIATRLIKLLYPSV